MVEFVIGKERVIDICCYPSGTEVVYFEDGGMRVTVAPDADPRIAGKSFYRWPDGSYVEDVSDGKEAIVIKNGTMF